MSTNFAALLYTGLMAIIVAFHLGLALGLPWGAASMGGKFPGRYPPRMRVGAGIKMVILCAFPAFVLSRAGVALPALLPFARWAIWLVVGYSALSTVLNIITRSKIERIWAPVVAAQLGCSLVVALS